MSGFCATCIDDGVPLYQWGPYSLCMPCLLKLRVQESGEQRRSPAPDDPGWISIRDELRQRDRERSGIKTVPLSSVSESRSSCDTADTEELTEVSMDQEEGEEPAPDLPREMYLDEWEDARRGDEEQWGYGQEEDD